MEELKNICSNVLNKMREREVNSCLAWIGGTARDFLRNKEPYDYDLIVYGLPFKKIEEIFWDVVNIRHVNSDAGVIRALSHSGKKLDVYLATRTDYSKEIGAWKRNTNYYEFLINKNVHHRDVIKHNLKMRVPRFSNNCINIHYPSMEVVTKDKWLNDFEDKFCSHLRARSRFVFGDYITLFKFASNGYEINKKTKRLFVDNSLIPYMTWSDKFEEDDVISIYQDIFLRNLKRVYNYEKRGKKFDPLTFYELCRKSKLFESLFYKSPTKSPSNLSRKEDFFLNVYNNNLDLLLNDVENKFIVEKEYNL